MSAHSFDNLDSPWTRALTLAGGLPFIGAAVLAITNTQVPIVGISATQLALSYSLLILSFMAGALWGYQMSQPPALAGQLLKTNFIVLAAWAASLLFSPAVALFVIAVGFVALLWMDVEAKRRALIGAAYLRLRMLITAIVVVSLFIVASQ